jgi:hypothetical protein
VYNLAALAQHSFLQALRPGKTLLNLSRTPVASPPSQAHHLRTPGTDGASPSLPIGEVLQTNGFSPGSEGSPRQSPAPENGAAGPGGARRGGRITVSPPVARSCHILTRSARSASTLSRLRRCSARASRGARSRVLPGARHSHLAAARSERCRRAHVADPQSSARGRVQQSHLSQIDDTRQSAVKQGGPLYLGPQLQSGSMTLGHVRKHISGQATTRAMRCRDREQRMSCGVRWSSSARGESTGGLGERTATAH